jgi:SAM-dependent methyltransferase
MAEDKTKRLSVYLPDKVKRDLELMAAETGLSMTQLIVMATHGLLANYKAQGGAMFAGLMDNMPRGTSAVNERIQKLRQQTDRMQAYYGARAEEYEKIYDREDPGYQEELAAVSAAMKEAVEGRSVLELACGTGYWTRLAADTARHITATDIRREVLDIAEAKGIPGWKASFRTGDAYELSAVPGHFDAALANFWFSHVPKNKIEIFLTGLHNRLGAGAVVFMADNVYVPGRGGELVYRDDCEDTFKLRELSDGSRHEIIKNYYSREELQALFKPWARQLKVYVGHSFWYVCYTL